MKLQQIMYALVHQENDSYINVIIKPRNNKIFSFFVYITVSTKISATVFELPLNLSRIPKINLPTI